MTREFKWEYIKRQLIFYRIFTFIILLALILAWAFKMTENTRVLIAYMITAAVTHIIDEIFYFYSKHKYFNGKTYKIKCLTFFILFAAGSALGKLSAPIVVIFLVYGILLICEDLVMDDLFDTYKGYTFGIIYVVLLGAGMVIPYLKKEITTANLFMYFLMVFAIALAVILVRRISILVAEAWNEKYNDVYFMSQDVKRENEKLLQLQERIEEVNSTINFQKVQLSETNTALEKRNVEINSLIEVMMQYTSSFDVKADMKCLIKTIKDIKNASLAALFIEKDVCFNEEPLFEYEANENYAPNSIRKDMVEVMNIFRNSESREPLVIAENYQHHRAVFERKGCCIVAFPAFEVDKFYGVLVVAGDKYDFFYNGFEYYKSAVMDFTASLISDRLYLTMEDMAKRDGLTKIYNRIHFNHFYDEMLDDIENNGGTISVLMADIDHFKNVNDTYGHLAGDEAIKALAKLDETIGKKYGCEAVRFGGEEFLLILEDTPLEKAREIAAELHEKIRTTTIHFEDYDININTSLGIATYPTTVQDTEKTLDRSDKAMYYGKTHGRGRIIVDGVDNVEA